MPPKRQEVGLLILCCEETDRLSTEEVSARLRAIRRACGASQRSLAKVMRVSVATLRAYENGTRPPRMGDLNRAGDALGVGVDYLIWGGDPLGHSDISTLRLQWKLGQMSAPQTERVLELIEGILSQSPKLRGKGSGPAPATPRNAVPAPAADAGPTLDNRPESP
jgi:transcriptional regulator with XRE-family HTH domain